MEENDLVLEFNSVYRELNDLYHDIALNIEISDSAFIIFYAIFKIGDGCLQRDICKQSYTNKQTINSTIQRLKADGYLFLKQGKGRDKHIYLTERGTHFLREKIAPMVMAEEKAFLMLSIEEQKQFISIFSKYVASFRRKVDEAFIESKSIQEPDTKTRS